MRCVASAVGAHRQLAPSALGRINPVEVAAEPNFRIARFYQDLPESSALISQGQCPPGLELYGSAIYQSYDCVRHLG